VGDAVTRQTRRLSGIADAARQEADESGKTGKGRTDIDLDLESIRELRQSAQALIPGD
jgi:hypothetical protein